MSKGIISIDIDSSGHKASLRFEPDANASEVTKERIMSACVEAGIGNLMNARRLDGVLADIAKARAKAEIVIAEGTLPRLATDSIIDFTKLGFTDELTPELARKIFAQVPVVYSREQTGKKFEREAAIKKSLPSMKSGEDKQVTHERVEKKERVSVDPILEDCGYVGEGEVLAVIKPGKPGKDGISIFGKAIKTTQPLPARLYMSDNIKLQGGSVISEVAGFVRRGKDWIELIHYREHAVEVKKSRDNLTCFVSIIPGTPGCRDLDTDSILARCSDLGFDASTLVSKEEMAKIAADAKNGKAVNDVPVSSPLDGKVLLNVSGDSVRAALSVTKGRGRGKQVTIDSVLDLVSKSGLAIKNKEKLHQDLTRFFDRAESELADYAVCEGKAPTKGADGKITYFVKFMTDAERKKMIETNAKNIASGSFVPSVKEFPVDSVENTAMVNADDKIAEITQPETGNDGTDVYGNQIPGIKGKAIKVRILENLVTNGTYIVATSEGVLDTGTQNETLVLRVRKLKNGAYKLVASQDNMKVYLGLSQGEGGGEIISKQSVLETLSKMKVTVGIKNDLLERLFKKIHPGAQVTNLLIAEGKKGDHVPAKVTFRVNIAGKKSERLVKKNELIAEIQPASGGGIKGQNVFGEPIDAPAGETGNERYIAGENVRKEKGPDGKTLYYADSDGILSLEKQILKISDIRIIEGDLDSHIGNLQVQGSVHVKGSVQSGIRLFASADIEVEGGVIASVISAGGSVKIHGDISGEGKAIVRAKKKIEARSAREAFIFCVGDISITSGCVRCNIKCNGKLFVNSDKGLILGGWIKASKGIDAFDIGGAGMKTHISFGQDYLLSEKIEHAEKMVLKLQAEVTRIDGITGSNKDGKSVSALELVRLRKAKFDHLKEIEGIKKDVLHLKDRFELHFPGAEIIARGTLSPVTVIESHMRSIEIKKAIEKIIVHFNQTNGWIEQTFFA